jgi:hypothetical protein
MSLTIPTSRLSGPLVFFAAQFDLEITDFDVQNAYLQSACQDEIYIRPPQGQPQEMNGKKYVYRLLKSLYGATRSGKFWTDEIHSTLISLGFKQSEHDRCLYYLHTPHSIILILLYVDDILVAHNKQDSAVYEQIMQGLFDKYSMRQVDLTRNRFLGIHITQSLEHGYVFLDQEQYAREILASFNMSEGRVFKVPSDGFYLPRFDSDQGVKFPYRSCLGSIRYLVSCTRPDLQYH